jgi:hypothetical protein
MTWLRALAINKRALMSSADSTRNWSGQMSFYFQAPDLAEFPTTFLSPFLRRNVGGLCLLKFLQLLANSAGDSNFHS